MRYDNRLCLFSMNVFICGLFYSSEHIASRAKAVSYHPKNNFTFLVYVTFWPITLNSRFGLGCSAGEVYLVLFSVTRTCMLFLSYKLEKS